MQRRVLVTRPEPGASRTATRLAEAGFAPVVLPLTEIRPLAARPIPADFAAVAVTSTNALRHAPSALIESLRGKPLFAVGSRTARLAREAGIVTVFEGNGDAASLASHMATQLTPSSRVLYLCGKVRRPDFEAVLAEAGSVVDALETYDTIAINHPAELAASALGNKPVEAAFVLSSKTAEALSSLVRTTALAHLFADTRYFCISGRVAAALTGIDPGHISISETPDEDALVALLERES
ncbi:uroporphyrinogen-III synthase [Mesorhizobium sp. ZC-5]|uniref:uroporphyrinogen-III synthase n=1 Tax=Mesorhizobium sp. ZC-5 TaxID=2986066 RepID=UPI0021E82023|nr:uroporphyrinogen-III synthase [Mesorhizobium sp. ZC-5]MCV3239125.1 uroporphyrinogen-III synthase [Mesorhizobium sp. ZC-5]